MFKVIAQGPDSSPRLTPGESSEQLVERPVPAPGIFGDIKMVPATLKWYRRHIKAYSTTGMGCALYCTVGKYDE